MDKEQASDWNEIATDAWAAHCWGRQHHAHCFVLLMEMGNKR